MVPSVFRAAKAAAVAYILDTPLRSDSESNRVTFSGNAIKLLSPEESSKNDKPPAYGLPQVTTRPPSVKAAKEKREGTTSEKVSDCNFDSTY